MINVFRRVSPITRRRIQNFRANRRGWWSLWIFLVLLVVSLFAEFIANDKPLLIRYNDSFYVPVFKAYPETEFGGDFLTEADYSSPYVTQLIGQKGWMIWPLIRYHHRTVAWDLTGPTPSRPDSTHWLGTDDLMQSSYALEGRPLDAYRAFAGDGVFRISVGLEDPEDLCDDLAQILG